MMDLETMKLIAIVAFIGAFSGLIIYTLMRKL
jgi:hypothetical protein